VDPALGRPKWSPIKEEKKIFEVLKAPSRSEGHMHVLFKNLRRNIWRFQSRSQLLCKFLS
jgi:hypothetical protein